MRRISPILVRSINPKQGSCQPYSYGFSFSKTSTTAKAHYYNQNLFQFYLPSSTFLSAKQHYARLSTLRNEPEKRNLLEVETISKEFLKPETPTPQHSRTYEVSLFDQLFPNIYMPFVFFYSNNLKNDSESIGNADFISKRRRLLKQSLSKTLTKFYPIAGRIKNNEQIDCNDDGVYYVEAKVSSRLSDFLDKPDNSSIHRLLPFHPDSAELNSLTHLVMVQVTSFSCGGIVIGLYTSHKILDAYSIALFVKAWAEIARGSTEEICPSFTAPSIFPSNPALSGKSRFIPVFSQAKTTTTRVRFSSSSLATLKKEGCSSRAMGVIGFLLKCTMRAQTKAQSHSNCNSIYTSLTMQVNLREKSSPPMPPYCIGNMFWTNFPIQCRADEELGLESIVQRIKSSTDKLNADFVEEIKGEGFPRSLEKSLNEQNMIYSDRNGKHMIVSSICHIGMYGSDFGWGKPIWVSYGMADTNNPNLENFVVLLETRSGNGIEAWVFLTEEDMVVFESNPELLALASLNPSPLEYVN